MGDLAIGIDLGMTNSCISLYINGKIKTLENPEGDRTTLSFIYFLPDGGNLVGKQARKLAENKPENGIYEVQRLIGRKYRDHHLQKSLKYLSYTVEADASNLPVISVKQKGNVIKKTPQQVYREILKHLKKIAEEKVGERVTKAVITVPAYFNVLQREVTLTAAKDAGFDVLKLLNEPAAVALAYYFEKDFSDKRRCLVYDLRDGTFDISVLDKIGKNIDVVCVDGDTQLGGKDFDKRIRKYVYKELKEKYQYVVERPEDKKMVRAKCVEAKDDLCVATETVIVINGMVPGRAKIKILLTREKFENMVDKLINETIYILDSCLHSSKISKQSIQEVILCGGSTRIPKVQQMLTEYFDGKKLSKFVYPDECVAHGAALQAAMLSSSERQKIGVIEMADVVPLSLGVSSSDHEMNFLIMRNTKIPASATKVFSTIIENQRAMHFKIYEGERADARLNRLLGTFDITNLTPAPPGELKVTATLSIDQNGILTAKAEEGKGKNVKELRINYTRGDRNENDVKRTIMEAEVHEEVDDKFKNFNRLKRYLTEYCSGVIYNLQKKKLIKKYKEAYDLCMVFRDITENFEMHKEDEIIVIIKKCKATCEKIVQKHKFKHMPMVVIYK